MVSVDSVLEWGIIKIHKFKEKYHTFTADSWSKGPTLLVIANAML